MTHVLSAAPKPGAPVLIVGADAATRSKAIAEAGGQVVGLVQAPLATIAAGLTDEGLSRLRKRPGIWAVLDAGAAGEICGAFDV